MPAALCLKSLASFKHSFKDFDFSRYLGGSVISSASDSAFGLHCALETFIYLFIIYLFITAMSVVYNVCILCVGQLLVPYACGLLASGNVTLLIICQMLVH